MSNMISVFPGIVIFCALMCIRVIPLQSQPVESLMASRYTIDPIRDVKALEESYTHRLNSNAVDDSLNLGVLHLNLAYLSLLKGRVSQHEVFENLFLARSLASEETSLLGDVSFLSGLFFYQQSLKDSAVHYFQNAQRLYDHQSDSLRIADCHGRIGDAHFNLGYQPDSSLFHYQKEMLYMGEQRASELYFMNLRNQSIIYSDKGQLKRAEKILSQATEEIDEDAMPLMKANCLNSLGLYQYYQSQREKAIRTYHQGIALVHSKLGKGHTFTWKLFNNLALAYIHVDQLDSADFYNELSHSVLLSSGLSAYSGYHYSNKGLINRRRFRFDEAIKSFERSLNYIAPTQSNRLGYTHNDIGLTYKQYYDHSKKIQYLDSSTAHFQKSLSYYSNENLDLDDPDQNPSFESLKDKFDSFEPLVYKSEVLRKRRVLSNDIEGLKKVLAGCELAEKLVFFRYSELLLDSSKFSFKIHSRSIYDEYLKTLAALYNSTGDKQFAREAIKIVERSKANVLLENLKFFGKMNSGELDNQVVFELLMDKFGLSPADGELISQENDFIDQRFYDRLSFIDYEEAKSLIGEDEAAIYYYLSEEESVVLGLTKDSLIFSLTPTSEMERNLVAYRGALSSTSLSYTHDEFDKYTKSAHDLYQQLVKPVIASQEDVTKKILIIPHGQISRIPFESFLLDMPISDKVSYRDLPYLIKQYDVSYIPSLSIYKSLEEIERPSPKKRSLVVTYGELINNQVPRNLIASEKESLLIGDILAADVLIDKTANKESFLDKVADYQLVHLALHGESDTITYQNRIFFNEIEKSDGVLTARDLYENGLKAELVYLGSCNSSTGKILEGEGIFSFARDFMIAGSSSVIGSLWDLNDLSTAKISTEFYRNLVEKELDKDQALRKAKLAYLEASDEILAHPFHWAPLIIIGNTKGLSQSFIFPISYFKVLALIVVLVVMALVIPMRRMIMTKRIG